MRNLRSISRFVNDWLSAHEGYRNNPEQRYLVELAVIESCTNVIRHACLPKSADLLCISMRRSEGTVEVVILDRGIPFDPTRVHPAGLEEEKEGGYGIHLIRTIMHRVRYRRRGRYWNALHLTHAPGPP